jgi:hypothetical protein
MLSVRQSSLTRMEPVLAFTAEVELEDVIGGDGGEAAEILHAAGGHLGRVPFSKRQCRLRRGESEVMDGRLRIGDAKELAHSGCRIVNSPMNDSSESADAEAFVRATPLGDGDGKAKKRRSESGWREREPHLGGGAGS